MVRSLVSEMASTVAVIKGFRCVSARLRLLKRLLFEIVGDDVRRGEGPHEVAASVARSGACARQPQHGTIPLPIDHLRKAPKVVIDIELRTCQRSPLRKVTVREFLFHPHTEGLRPPSSTARIGKQGEMLLSPAGCSKRPFSKAAADGSTGGVAPGYVEDAFKARTKLAGFFSILLVRHLAFLE
jgi:hypothetical protein